MNRGARQSRFARVAGDCYDTIDPRAVQTLLPFLEKRTRFIEPCAGAGHLVRQLEAAGHKCKAAIDVEPRDARVFQGDALAWNDPRIDGHVIITNPPYAWPILSRMIPHFGERVWFSWLLLEASFMHTARAAPLMRRCRKIVSIGRLKWVEGSAHGSTKDYCWYQFGTTEGGPMAAPLFYPRRGSPEPVPASAAVDACEVAG